MTKTDFEVISKMIKEMGKDTHLSTDYKHYVYLQGVKKDFVIELANYLKTKNQYFDREKFISACLD